METFFLKIFNLSSLERIYLFFFARFLNIAMTNILDAFVY